MSCVEESAYTRLSIFVIAISVIIAPNSNIMCLGYVNGLKIAVKLRNIDGV